MGDRNAFTDLIKDYYPIVMKTIRRRVRNEKDAEDVCQQVFAKLIRQIDERVYEEKKGRLFNWIFRTTFSKVKDHLRRTYERGTIGGAAVTNIDEAEPMDAAAGHIVQDSLIYQTACDIFRSVFKQLRPEKRSILMCVYPNLAYTQISDNTFGSGKRSIALGILEAVVGEGEKAHNGALKRCAAKASITYNSARNHLNEARNLFRAAFKQAFDGW